MIGLRNLDPYYCEWVGERNMQFSSDPPVPALALEATLTLSSTASCLNMLLNWHGRNGQSIAEIQCRNYIFYMSPSSLPILRFVKATVCRAKSRCRERLVSCFIGLNKVDGRIGWRIWIDQILFLNEWKNELITLVWEKGSEKWSFDRIGDLFLRMSIVYSALSCRQRRPSLGGPPLCGRGGSAPLFPLSLVAELSGMKE